MKTTVLVVAPFRADPYCGCESLISCSPENPCILDGYEVETLTGRMHIANPKRLTTITVEGRYIGPLWHG